MNAQIHAVLFAAVVTAVCGCATNATTDTTQLPEVAPLESLRGQEYEVSTLTTGTEYDPGANPSENLVATVSEASESGKRIILEIGGQW